MKNREIIKYVKDVLIYKSSGKADLYNEEEISNIKTLADKVTKEKLVNLIYELSKLETDIKWSTQKTIMFQAGIIKLCSNEFESSNNIEERVDKIEKYLKSGRVAVNTMQVPVSATTVNQTQNYNLNNRVQSTPKVASNTVKQNTMANKTKQYSSDLSKSWPTIVNDLKQNGKIVLYTNLMNTSAEEINDMTVGIKFPNGLSSFGKTVLEKQENIKEISTLVSMACGKDMQIKYISEAQNQVVQHRPEDDIQKLANQSDIPFNVIE